jgi:hypothetical protein
VALVGDLHVKIWNSYQDPLYTMVKYRRTHQFSSCATTYALAHEDKVVLLTADSDDGFFLDLNAPENQAEYKMPLLKKAIPVFFDHRYIVVAEVHSNGPQTVLLHDINTSKVAHTFKCHRQDKFYWGFQLSGNQMAYVTNQNRLKVVEIGEPWTLLHRLDGAGGSRILTFLFDAQQDVWTLNSDHSLNRWRQGTLVQRWAVDGDFDAGYPHILYRCGPYMFYSADDGVYAILVE